MVRDLALFQNDFYISELEKIYRANFGADVVDSPGQMGRNDKADELDRLKWFLKQIVESHPTYQSYLDRSRKRVREQMPFPLDALSWLIQHHLQPRVSTLSRKAGRSGTLKAFWIRHPIPVDMEIALDKLLPAITKYIRMLGQFFLRQAAQGLSVAGKPQDHRMSNASFMNLMKQVRVFPQLFHRRELENAVKMSCCSSPENEELNFPEFVEALVRCSCSLRWDNLDGSKNANRLDGEDTVIVVKFLMLIFAMEGQGSVLQKRNDDLNILLGFLGQQQQRKKAERLYRFHKMLADDTRRSQKAKNRRKLSIWSHVRLQFSPTNSPTKTHDTFEELTRSWDNGSPRDEPFTPMPSVFDAQTDQPFGWEVASPVSNDGLMDTIGESRAEASLDHPTAERDDRYANLGNVGGNDGNPPGTSSGVSLDERVEPVDELPRHREVFAIAESESTNRELSSSRPAEDANASREGLEPANSNSMRSHEAFQLSAAISDAQRASWELGSGEPNRLSEPMEKNDFLQEILTSIGDVELVLNQSRFASNGAGHGNAYCENAAHRRCFQFLTTLFVSSANRPQTITHSDSFLESWQSSPSLCDLAAASNSSSGDWEDASDTWISSEGRSHLEVSVHDPILNYLTDIDRFTESTGTDGPLSHLQRRKVDRSVIGPN
ncbi:hypothetical protein BBJ28_00016595 [Nothophytophthora sp. Chile5]|nr:hypothetical protein BBJ28_00016595 [Nothophytophthora sp. Chile5]